VIPGVDTRSLRAERLRALAPRLVFGVTLGILALAGLRAAVMGPPAPAAAPRVAAVPDQGAQGLAEGFARAYLSWDASHPEARERALRPFLSDSLETDGGLAPASGTQRSVSWTAAVAEQRRGSRRTITVAVGSSDGPIYLAVPVDRDARGLLSVGASPALVGPPPVDRSPEAEDEEEVEDGRLSAVATRAVSNYLARERADLLADLAPEATVSLPAQRLSVRSEDPVTWAVPDRRVAVQVQAEDELRNRWTLRYELEVSRRDRWYVRSLHVDPTNQGGRSP
jgi:hypothetical protein